MGDIVRLHRVSAYSSGGRFVADVKVGRGEKGMRGSFLVFHRDGATSGTGTPRDDDGSNVTRLKCVSQ